MSTLDVDRDELRELVDTLLQRRAALPRMALLRQGELNVHLGALGFLLRYKSYDAYIRRWGTIASALAGPAFGYIWLWKLRSRAGSWEDVLTDPLSLLGAMVAVLLGGLCGYWRTRYDWKERVGRIERARELAKDDVIAAQRS